MSIEITMPALSPTMEEGNLAKWLVKEGDKVSAGDVLAEIETDKATMEVESIDDGIIAKLLVPAGSVGVKVNQVIAILVQEGEDIERFPKSGNRFSDKKRDETQGPQGKPAPANIVAPVPDEAPTFKTSEQPANNTPTVMPVDKRQERGPRIFASPLARRLGKEAGIALETLVGSGPHGRIIAQDIKAALAAGASTLAPPQPITQISDEDDKIRRLFREGDYQLQPHDSMRKTIARRLVQSKQQVPHFYVTIDCQLDSLLELRAEINRAAPLIETEQGQRPAYKLSVNDMVIKAVALALKAHPDANVSWTESAMIRHKFVDVGVAVSIPGGLMTPIITKAEQKSLSFIANEMKDLAARARGRRLKPEEYQGGSTAVSNMGMYGVKSFAAIINPPQSTIFAIGSGEQRAIVKEGALRAATMMTVTISADHRAVDGALAAELSQTFKSFIENPISMLV